ncbi:MAG: MBL fold metallo-hydrolase [candidate division WOR-3 bacterium]
MSDINLEKVIYPPLYVNTYIVFDQKKNAIIIDPGGSYKNIKEILTKRNLNLKAVFVTHSHFDHVLGIPMIECIDSIPVYIPEKDLNLYNSARDFTKNFLGFDPGEFKKPDFLLKGGEEINIGEIKIKVHHVPGHTMGHLLYEIDEKIFCGDLIFSGSIGRTDFPESSWKDMKNSLLYLINNFPPNYELYPGHGPKTDIEKEKLENPFLKELF